MMPATASAAIVLFIGALLLLCAAAFFARLQQTHRQVAHDVHPHSPAYERNVCMPCAVNPPHVEEVLAGSDGQGCSAQRRCLQHCLVTATTAPGIGCCRRTFPVYTVRPAGSENPNVNRAPGFSPVAVGGPSRALAAGGDAFVRRRFGIPPQRPFAGALSQKASMRRRESRTPAMRHRTHLLVNEAATCSR